MASVLRDSEGIPIPQYINNFGTFEALEGANGAMNVNVKGAAREGVNASSRIEVISIGTTAVVVPYTEANTEIRIMHVSGAPFMIGFNAAVTEATGIPVGVGGEYKLPLAGGTIYLLSESTSSARIVVI